jgi:integrase
MLGDARLAHRTTLGSVLLRYRDQCSPGKRGARSEQARVSAMARHAIAGLTLAKLSSSMFASYRDERLQTAAPATVVRELSLIQTALETATREWGIPLPCNPVKLVRRPAVRNERRRRVHRDEEARLLAAARSHRSAWMLPLLVVGNETGMRRGELLALTWSDVDLHSRIARVRNSKNGDSRDIPLSGQSIQMLKELRRKREGGFESDGDAFVFPFTASAVRLAFERIRARAELPDIHFHDLRREAITRFLERGLNLIETSQISGHRDIRVLRRYVVPDLRLMLRKLDKSDPVARIQIALH